MRRKRKQKFRTIVILPPVMLAALFIWLLSTQLKSGEVSKYTVLKQVPVSEGSVLAINEDSVVMKEEVLLEPEQVEPEPPEPEAALGTSLLFAGDIYLSGHVLNAYDKAGGIEGVLDSRIREMIDGADWFMANEEFPFSARGVEADKEYAFRLPPERVQMMKEIGLDLVSLANNHTMDYGSDALLDTLETLYGAGILYVGAGANLEEAKKLQVIEQKGIKIGFLAASHVMPDYSWAASKSRPGVLETYDPSLLLKEIAAARPLCDYLVVYVHWGIEKKDTPEEYQRTLGAQYIDAGADIVIGSHPHVLQGIEYYNGKPIVYSLGNFVFGSSIPKTALLKVDLPEQEDGAVSLKLLPCTSAAGYTKVMDEASWPEFYSYLESISFGISINSQGQVNHSP